MKTLTPPCSTYRLQFNADFTFVDASKIIPYLQLLGISHIYASPFLKARAGSPHGYDIVDHNALNPEIGDENSFTTYIETLRQHGMGQILDIVPNHMGVGGSDNAWWLDVLENGEASVYADYFNIDWHPVNPALHNKVLLPFLADHYGTVLEQGELTLELNPDNGAFNVRYYEHLFPIDPRSYPPVLNLHIETLEQRLKNHHEVFNALVALIADCQTLPRRTELSAAHRQKRHRGVAACKQRLAELYRNHSEIQTCLNENIKQFNGSVGQPKSFNLLHRLLEAQAYRLAYWQVASDEINYRRFFDINELAGIRMENSEVFDATHRLIKRLIENGEVNGLRIDHPDGLSDPYGYCCNLQRTLSEHDNHSERSDDNPCYLLVEKILASHEHLPADWPVAGTTGYEVAHLLNGLFVYPDSERSLSQLYRRFTGQAHDFDELLYVRKRLIMRSALASELTVLANLASNIAQADRATRDFTHNSLRTALAEVVACFPVYRTYITRQRISEEDHRYSHWAIAQAKKRSPAADIQIFDFIQDLLTLRRLDGYSSRVQRQITQFALRFQQYTAPVMAKSMEDTAFYTYNRLVSLNDVGFDPRVFGVSINAFHHENHQRLDTWPQSMVTTSTHDSKRGEDVRARINVLSEVPHQWRGHLARWRRINRRKKRLVDDTPAPSRNDEYLLYQTLVGTWPLAPFDAANDTAGFDAFRERIEAYMLKAIKEAKAHTSWINPNSEYEDAMRHFVQALLGTPERNAFLADFISFQKRIARYGLLNSLSQTLLKLTMPGVPDIYQGNELWSFNLVDPDNRRPVDYHHRQTLLQGLMLRYESNDSLASLLHELLEHIEDGRVKLYLTWKIMRLRNEHAALFSEGDYTRITTEGQKADHICAFSRQHDDKEIIVVATRWFAHLLAESDAPPPGNALWGNALWDGTRIQKSGAPQNLIYRNILTDETVQAEKIEDEYWLSATDLFRHFPMALLISNNHQTA